MWKLLNVNLGPRETDQIIQMIKISEWTPYLSSFKNCRWALAQLIIKPTDNINSVDIKRLPTVVAMWVWHELNKKKNFFHFSNFLDDIVYADVNPLPIFTAGVTNLTVTSGRNAQLTCKVENLGNYKVTI